VGGLNATGLASHIQQHPDADKLKIALVTDQERFHFPQAYFGVIHGHLNPLKLQCSSSPANLVDEWSRTEEASVTKVKPDENTVELSNGRSFTYKALVLAPGLEHKVEHTKGLAEFEAEDENAENFTFGHVYDNERRQERNYWSGTYTKTGDFLCYSPKTPYKGEGTDFYALYYEHFLRQDRLQGCAPAGSRMQYWTPNKEIF